MALYKYQIIRCYSPHARQPGANENQLASNHKPLPLTQWRTQDFFFKGGVLQLNAGCDATQAVKRSLSRVGGWGDSILFKFVFLQTQGSGILVYMTADLSDNQASKL